MERKEYTNIDPDLLKGDSPFKDKLLIAMPSLTESFFNKSVIYICAHSPAGAMGIVINQALPDVAFSDLLEQLELPQSQMLIEPTVHFGGPVETGRGFVLHSMDFQEEETMQVTDQVFLTGTIDILRAIAEGNGPYQSVFALGYAGWGPGQLEEEMQSNSWLSIDADEELLFGTDLPCKWEKALSRLGVTPSALSSDSGHA